MVGRSLFGRPATEMYPERRRAYPDAARGSVANDIIRCIFCGQCQRKCPTGAILVAKEEAAWRIDSLKCCSCRRCVEVCPVSCLIMRNTYWPAVTEREAGRYTVTVAQAQAHLYDSEGSRPGAAPPRSTAGSRTGAKVGF